MAVIKIWDIKDSLRRLLVYITNHNKTKNENYTDDPSAMPYFISGINCDSDMAYEDMMITKQQYQKTGGILAFHAVQSFKPGEITPELAHQLGVEYAKEMWGDRFEVIVATHTDHEHIHNHFAINSVSFKDGKRYYDNKANYRAMQKLNDTLCEKYCLSVIKQKKNIGQPYAAWKAEKQNQPTRRALICCDVEYAITNALTYSQFMHHLKEMGYLIKTNVKHIAVCPPGSNKFFRLCNLTKDQRYAEDMIKERILKNRNVSSRRKSKPIKMKGKVTHARRITGIRALYIKYQYRMGVIPKNVPNRKVHFYFKQDLIYLEKITQEVTLMCKKKIHTMTDLENCMLQAKNTMSTLMRARTKSYNKLRRCSDPIQIENIKKEIMNLSEDIRKLRKEVVLYEGIKARSIVIKEKLNVTKQDKEREQNERHWRNR